MQKNQDGFGILEILAFIVLVTIVGIIGLHFHKVHQADSNTKYFDTLSTRTKTYYDEQVEALGVQSSDNDLIKECYRSEQGPFDSGNLWCGIFVTKKISIDPDQATLQSLVDKLKTVLKTQNFSVAVHGSNVLNGFSVDAGIGDGSSPKLCGVVLDYSPDTAYADAKTSLQYSLHCSNRSSGLVPGFTDNSHNL